MSRRAKIWLIVACGLVLTQVAGSLLLPQKFALIALSDIIQFVLLLSGALALLPNVLASHGIKKLPVMESGKLVGMLTQTDIVDSSFALVTSLKEMVRARYRPPDFQP